jgi:outer membrane protein OmpA-like peptidoglycan-associated protein
MVKISSVALLVAGFAAFLFGTLEARATEACPRDFRGQSESLTCACPAEATRSGSVWGTITYTADSQICRAALHAGAVTARGGDVTVLPEVGRDAYIGSRRNGVQTSDYGNYRSSFRFQGIKATGPEPCPATLRYHQGVDRLTCACDASATASGSVWGHLVYTADSRICRAALHAGATGRTGGEITILPEPGRQTYSGSTRNGVQTNDHGPYRASFRFDGVDTAAIEPCPQSMRNRAGIDRLTCACEASALASGAVWGSFVYTADSRICRAALHAGAVGREGGTVTVLAEAGRPGYRGSTRNGVTTSAYDEYGASFRFDGIQAQAIRGLCPQRFTGFGGETEPLECICPGDATISGDVWGTDVYTSDSRICRAALHAGAIDRFGGPIKVVPMPGQDAYRGSNRNGVRTGDYGTWRHSFRVEGERRAASTPVQAPVAESLDLSGQVQLYINFRTGSAEIQASAEPVLRELMEALRANGAMRLRLVGHTDSTGTPAGNRTLSQRRAESVRTWLVRQGIEANRFAAEGRGQDEPIADNTTDQGRALNRRVQAVKAQ